MVISATSIFVIQRTLTPLLLVISLVVAGCDSSIPTALKPLDGAPSDVGTLSRLSVRENVIVDEEDNVRILRGVAVIDPLLWRDYRFGPRRLGEHHFQELAEDWNANIVRVPIHPDPYASDPLYLSKYVDPIVEWGCEYGIYIFLGYHAHGNPITLEVEDTPWGFDEPWRGNPYNPDVELAVEALGAIVSRYHDTEWVMYGSFNEPAFIRWRDWRPVAERLVDVIHEIDPRALVTVSGVDFASNLSGIAADPVRRPNVVYEIHPYPWVSDDWKDVVDQLLESYPVFVGEWAFGDEHPATDSGYAQPLIDFCRDRGLGWTAWIWDHEWTPRMFQDRYQTELTEFGFTVRSALTETANATLAQGGAR